MISLLLCVTALLSLSHPVVAGDCKVWGRAGTCLGASACSAKPGYRRYPASNAGVDDGCRYEPVSVQCCAPDPYPPKGAIPCSFNGLPGSCTKVENRVAGEAVATWNEAGSDGACRYFPSGVACVYSQATTTTSTTTSAPATTTSSTSAAPSTASGSLPAGPACSAHGQAGACVAEAACALEAWASVPNRVTGCEREPAAVKCCAPAAPPATRVAGPTCYAHGVEGGCVERAACPATHTSYASQRGAVTGCEAFAASIQCCAVPDESAADAEPSGVPQAAVDLIKQFEGLHLSAYRDPLSGGLPITIGYGSTRRRDGSRFQLGDRISLAEAEDLLKYQLEKDYMPVMASKIPTWSRMNGNQRGAVISFGYNLGAHFYGSSSFRTISRVLADPSQWRSKIRSALVLYRNPGSNVEKGLLRRRNAEADVFLTPVGAANLVDTEGVADDSSADQGIGSGAIIGIIVGVVVLIALVALIAYFVGFKSGSFTFFEQFTTRANSNTHQEFVEDGLIDEMPQNSPRKATVGSLPASQYSCAHCEASFARVEKLASHVQKEHPVDAEGNVTNGTLPRGYSLQTQYQCALCNEGFAEVDSLTEHVEANHY